jgi:hypothetical protein
MRRELGLYCIYGDVRTKNPMAFQPLLSLIAWLFVCQWPRCLWMVSSNSWQLEMADSLVSVESRA